MNEEWYEETYEDNFLTDRLVPLAFACIPVAVVIYSVVKWLRGH